MGLKRTHVFLREEHLDWADEENKNLSKEVRELLDERVGVDADE